MYTEEYERRGFPFRDFLLKLILIIIFVFLLVWLLPKFISPSTVVTKDSNCSGTTNGEVCDNTGIKALTSQIFSDNLEKMKEAAINYYTDERLPQEVGASDTMTLSDMIGKHLITPLIDKNNKAVDVNKSYVKITKMDDEYILKINIKDSEKEDYILVHLGCYNYCDSYLCEKQKENVDVKGSTEPSYNVPIKGSTGGFPVIPVKPEVKHYCEIYNGRYYGKYGSVVDQNTYKAECIVTPTPTPTPDEHYCVVYNGKYYGRDGEEVTKEEYKEQCQLPDEHYCVVYDGKYYGKDGEEVTKEEYKEQCQLPDEHYCVVYDGKYYGKDGKVVSRDKYFEDCTEKPEPTVLKCTVKDGKYYDSTGIEVSRQEFERQCMPEEEHYCVVYKGKYYGKDGKEVTKEQYKSECQLPDEHYCVFYDGKYYGKDGKVVSEEKYREDCMPVDKHYCVIYNGDYYGKNGDIVTEKEYKEQCQLPDEHYCVFYDGKYYGKDGDIVTEADYKKQCMPAEEHYCVFYDGKYYGKDGKVVSEDEYKKQCQSPQVQYIYEYKKTTGTKLSQWSNWSEWSKTSCDTKEVNCSDNDITCLAKTQLTERKEKIGTYKKPYIKYRDVIKQTGSYEQKACTKYDYVVINKKTYATTTTVTHHYSVIDTITRTTKQTVGGWTYNGRASYSNPPSDTATKHYKFVGADFSYCNDTCTSLPNYYYDSYSYTGGNISSVTKTTSAPGESYDTTDTDTTVTTEETATAKCGAYTTKTIPIYGTIRVSDVVKREEPLYGNVCYKSTKTRNIIEKGKITYKWSTYNNQTLINEGYVMTGNKKVK